LPENRPEIRPEEETKVLFLSASAFARKIDVKKKIVAFSSSHRGQAATLDDGWIIIDQAWYPK
jgi:hypothetical protein